jgi:membrane protein implicated in regulation of membrane protease activity
MDLQLTTDLICLAGPPLTGFVFSTTRMVQPYGRLAFYLTWIFGGAANILVSAVTGDWQAAGCSAATVLLALLSLWWRRRRRGRALREAGARARARIAAMIGTMRERARPAPGLRPAPQPG